MANTVTTIFGSDIVTGDLTQFVAHPGDTLVVNGLSAKIKYVEHSARLVLEKPWVGPPAQDAAHWDILKTSEKWHSVAEVSLRVMQLLERLEAGMPFKPDAFGTLAGRAQYENQDAGFIYLVTDANPAVLYLKRSITAGDWGAAIQVQGPPGPEGQPGPSSVPPPVFSTEVQTLPAGQQATATVSGTYPNLVITLGIPQGAGGATGPQGTVLTSVTYSGSRTLQLTDGNKRIRMDLATNGTLTVPSHSAVPFPVDTEIEVFCANVGDVTILAASGVTLVPNTGLTMTEVGQSLRLKKVADNTWDVIKALGTGTGTTTPPVSVTLGTLSLSNSSIPENAPIDTVVGAILGKTPDSLVSLPGDAGGRFRLVSGMIEVASSALDFETQPSHQITLRESLAGATNSPRDTTLTITLQDVPDTVAATLNPLTITAATIAENSPEGTLIGTIGARTIGSQLTLANNAAGKVKLSGTSLLVGPAGIDFETTPTFQVVARETLTGATNTPRDTTFTITVTNVAEGGTGAVLNELHLTSGSIASNAYAGALVGTIERRTADSNLEMIANGGGRFTLVDNEVRTTGALPFDWANTSNHIITIRESLPGAVNTPRETTFRIAVAQVLNESLSPLRLQPNVVAEDTPNGNLIGTLLDITHSSQITLLNDAGGKVKIEGGNFIKVGAAGLDFETAPSFQIVVRETVPEMTGSPKDTILTINVADVLEGGGGTTPDTSPNQFEFPSLSGMEPNTTYISDPVTLSGVSAPTPISASGGEISVAGGAFVTSTTFLNNQTVRARLLSSSLYSTAKGVVVTAGDKQAAFTVTTRSNSTAPATDVSIASMTTGPWKCTMPYNSSNQATGTAVEIWPPALATTDNQWFDRQPEGSIVFASPTTGARTSGSNYVRCELREIRTDGTNEYEWTPATGGRMENTCAVLELPVLTKEGNDRRVIIGQIHGPNDEPCRLYYMKGGYLSFADDKAGSSQTETFFVLRNSQGQQAAIPLGAKFTYCIEMDTSGIRVQAVYDGQLYTAFSPLSSFWVGKLMYFKAGSYNSIGYPGQGMTNEGTGQARVQFWRILGPKHPHTIGASLDPNAGGGTTVTLNTLAVLPNIIPERSPQNTVVGSISGLTTGSQRTLTNDAGGRFAISGTSIVTGAIATNFDVAASHSITIRETLAGATNTPKDTTVTITVTDVGDTPTLGVLGLTAATMNSGVAQNTVIGAITGKSANSVLELADDAGGRFAISGTNLVAGPVPTDVSLQAAHQIIVTETLQGATNSPRSTALTVTIVENLPVLPDGWAFVTDTVTGAYVMFGADHVITPDTGDSVPNVVDATVVRTLAATSAEASVTSLAVQFPTPPTAGNLLIACFSPDKNAGAFATPSGWNQIVVQTATSVSGVLYWRRATGTETNVTGQWTGACRSSAMVMEIANVNGAISAAYKHTTALIADTAISSMSLQPAGDVAAGEFAVAFAMVDTFTSVSGASWTNGWTAHPVTAGSGAAAGIFAATKTVFPGGNLDTMFSHVGTADQMFGFIASFRLTA